MHGYTHMHTYIDTLTQESQRCCFPLHDNKSKFIPLTSRKSESLASAGAENAKVDQLRGCFLWQRSRYQPLLQSYINTECKVASKLECWQRCWRGKIVLRAPCQRLLVETGEFYPFCRRSGSGSRVSVGAAAPGKRLQNEQQQRSHLQGSIVTLGKHCTSAGKYGYKRAEGKQNYIFFSQLLYGKIPASAEQQHSIKGSSSQNVKILYFCALVWIAFQCLLWLFTKWMMTRSTYWPSSISWEKKMRLQVKHFPWYWAELTLLGSLSLSAVPWYQTGRTLLLLRAARSVATRAAAAAATRRSLTARWLMSPPSGMEARVPLPASTATDKHRSSTRR